MDQNVTMPIIIPVNTSSFKGFDLTFYEENDHVERNGWRTSSQGNYHFSASVELLRLIQL
jgi:hypothetical protein